MVYRFVYISRTIVFMVLAMLLLSTPPAEAAFLIKKESINKPLVSKNTTKLARLYEKLTAIKNEKGSFFSKTMHLIKPHGYEYGESKGNLLSILSLVCGCLAYFALFAGLFVFVITLSTSSILGGIVGGGVFALAAIVLGAIALNHHQTRGMAIAGIILGSILLTMYGFVALILASYS